MSQHFNFEFFQCSAGIYQAFDPVRDICKNFMHVKIVWSAVFESRISVCL